MLRVYNYMAAGLAITGIVAYLVFSLAVTAEPAGHYRDIRAGVII